jgi:hypothetical protein
MLLRRSLAGSWLRAFDAVMRAVPLFAVPGDGSAVGTAPSWGSSLTADDCCTSVLHGHEKASPAIRTGL